MLLLLLCRCFDVLLKQDDKGDASNRDNGSCISRNLGGDSDLDRAPSSLLRAWALGLVFEWSQPPLDALFIPGCSGEYSDENEIPFQILSFYPGRESRLVSGSSSSGLEGMVLPKLLPAVALPFLHAGESGVGHSAMAEVAGVGAAERIGTVSAGLEGVGPIGCRWSRRDCQSNTSFLSSDEKCTSSVVPALAEVVADG
ncbi:hypothetical protein V6N12_049175 [Hibiscus sabdariffa]|uniref:Uncharacterized protein n=1 Tax=Hibiscus sabdariffa TaxID=183260 RepID=A0ABR2EN65_9ROSI